MNSRVYLDWNATAPLRPEAKAAMVDAMDVIGNPSSVHAEGRAVKAMVERARADVAELAGCKPTEVVFTSGATEAALVLADPIDGQDVLVDETAHDALWTHKKISKGPQQPGGPGHTLAMGLANSETGIITPPPAKIDGLWTCAQSECARWLLLDITQAIGRIPFSFAWSEADHAVMSAHKLGGPKGVGALIVRDGIDIPPLVSGGGQESGRRSGTENTIGIVGFGAACRAAAKDFEAGVWLGVAELRNILENTIEAAAEATIFVGKGEDRLPNTSCLVSTGWKGETQVMAMDLMGFAVSSGSACSSGKVKKSRVLQAMGYDENLASSAIRVSLGPTTKLEEVTRFAEAWCKAHERHRARAA